MDTNTKIVLHTLESRIERTNWIRIWPDKNGIVVAGFLPRGERIRVFDFALECTHEWVQVEVLEYFCSMEKRSLSEVLLVCRTQSAMKDGATSFLQER